MKKPVNVIITCGKRKHQSPMPAIDLYCGSFFLAMKRWALSITSHENVFIVSAKYGLIRGSQVIRPYNAKMGTSSQKINADLLKQQSWELRLRDRPSLFVGGRAYLDILKSVIPNVQSVFDYVPGTIGKKQKWLSHHLATLPKPIYDYLATH